jgi:prevent-host-death family protein
MVNNLTMIVVNVLEAKTKLSELLEQVAGGTRVVICKRNQPIAELHPVRGARTAARPLGLAKGTVTVPDAFFDPLPADVVAPFEDDQEPADRLPSSHVAETPPKHDGGGKAGRRPRGRR